MAQRRSHPGKAALIETLIREFRVSGNQDDAFDSLAAAQLRVSETDLRCLNIIENGGGLTAGELASQSGLTAGAVTGVIDRLAAAGYATRDPDPTDRRRVRIRVTPAFYAAADRLWGPVAADWNDWLSRLTVADLERVIAFLEATNAIGRRHMDRLREAG